MTEQAEPAPVQQAIVGNPDILDCLKVIGKALSGFQVVDRPISMVMWPETNHIIDVSMKPGLSKLKYPALVPGKTPGD